MQEQPPALTALLEAAANGNPSAHDQLWALIYEELHAMARRQLAGDGVGRRRQPTSIVHEAYLRLAGGQEVEWANRRHFFAAAARAMRCIRVDDARKRGRLKRGGGQPDEHLEELPSAFDKDPTELLALDEALRQLEQGDPRKAEVVNLRFFAGLTGEETAAAMGLSPRTVDKEWRFAKAWLYRELGGEG